MSEKIRVYNPQKFDVGIVTLDKPLGINIKAGSFAQITDDDVAYITSISTIFQRGVLRLDEDKKEQMESVGIDVTTDPHFVDDADIQKKLSGSAKKVEEWLQTIDEEYLLDRIFDVAITMNLSVNKIKVLQEKMPNRNFIG